MYLIDHVAELWFVTRLIYAIKRIYTHTHCTFCASLHTKTSPAHRDLGQVLRSQLPVVLRCEIPAEYPCCVGSASE